MRKRDWKGFAPALVAVLLAAAPAGAQTHETQDELDRAMAGAPPSGVAAGELRAPAPPEATSPAAPQVAVPAAASGPVASPAPSPFLVPGAPGAGQPAADPTDEINANYDATVEIYQGILDKQSTDPGNLDRRIKANEEMIAKYRPALVQAESELRKLQVEFMGRAFALKEKRDSGQITEDAFGKAIEQEELKGKRRRDSLQQDIAFYKEEIAAAEARLKDLREKRKAVSERAEKEGKAAAAMRPKPGEALLQGFSGTLDKLSGFKTRYTMDGNARCPACNSFHGHGEAHKNRGN
jgi:hypothetical protein